MSRVPTWQRFSLASAWPLEQLYEGRAPPELRSQHLPLDPPAIMQLLLNLVLAPIVLIWLLPLLSDLMAATKVLFGARGRPEPVGRGESPQSLLILVPAHNESGQISDCVAAIGRMESTSADVRLIVIADNCSDDTATKARAEGAEVWERTNLDLRGKPHAIQWALDRCELDQIDCISIVDADAQVHPEFAKALVESGALRERAVQTYNALLNPDGGWAALLGDLLGRSKYEGQYQLKARAGLNAPMTGNGMCMGTGLIRRCGWASDALTENWEMYARFTLAGERIDLVIDARVASIEPEAVEDSTVRRRRWQAGKWSVLKRYVVPLLTRRGIPFHQRIDLLAELVSPGPVAHAGIGFGLGALVVLLAPAWPTTVLGWALIASPLPTVVWTAHAIAGHPEPGKVLRAMFRLPFYLLWRITILPRALPTYLGGAWRRSPRADDA